MKRVGGRQTRDDLRRLGGGGSAEVTAFSNGVAPGYGGWVTTSSMTGSVGNSRTGGIPH